MRTLLSREVSGSILSITVIFKASCGVDRAFYPSGVKMVLCYSTWKKAGTRGDTTGHEISPSSREVRGADAIFTRLLPFIDLLHNTVPRSTPQISPHGCLQLPESQFLRLLIKVRNNISSITASNQWVVSSNPDLHDRKMRAQIPVS